MKNTLPFFNSKIAGIASIAFASFGAHAAVITWDNASTDGNWDTAANWNPIGIPGNQDKAVINNGDTVTKTGSIILNDLNGTTEDGLSLTNGTLNVSVDFTTFTSGGSTSSPNSHVGVDGGATTGTLNIDGILNLGNTKNTSGSSASLTVFGGSLVDTGAFQGRHTGSSSSSNTGGWLINVTGGTFNAGTFDWSTIASSDPDPQGRLIIGSTDTAVGGTVTIGTMSDDWADRSGQYALFNDELGSLTFGKTNYANIADVQNLITNDFIRKDAGIINGFGIADNGTSWTVSIVPEPSTYALLFGAIILPFLVIRRKR